MIQPSYSLPLPDCDGYEPEFAEVQPDIPGGACEGSDLAVLGTAACGECSGTVRVFAYVANQGSADAQDVELTVLYTDRWEPEPEFRATAHERFDVAAGATTTLGPLRLGKLGHVGGFRMDITPAGDECDAGDESLDGWLDVGGTSYARPAECTDGPNGCQSAPGSRAALPALLLALRRRSRPVG